MPPNKRETSEPTPASGGADDPRGHTVLLGGLSPARFLKDYWQKRPLLIRQALPGFRSPLTPEELAGLACEEEVESRLILERDGTRPWQLEHGPFDETRFAQLPASHWTVLVQGCDRHVPALAELLEQFDFIPRWRIDDIMVSYAAPQGSVGPHFDQYDVFLLQGLGRRRWSISTQPVSVDNCLDGTELHIMREFTAEQTWDLAPGDMLYLPPGVAHHGVALEPCLTFSVGFRAPAAGDLLAEFAAHAAMALPASLRYADPDLTPPEHPGEITAAALVRARTLLRRTLRDIAADDDALDRWFATFVTQPEAPQPAALEPVDTLALIEHIRRGGALRRADASRLAYIDQGAASGTHGACLYVDGEEYPLPPQAAPLAPLLCDHRRIAAADLIPLLERPGVVEQLAALCTLGALALLDPAATDDA